MKSIKISGNGLKILALIAMTFDHVGLLLLNNYMPFRIFGRLAFPIFAYMIAEGCYYTRNKKKHLAVIFLMGLFCQFAYYLADGSLYQGILITFTLSILCIYAIDWARKQKKWYGWIVPLLTIGMVIFLCQGLPILLPGTHYAVDYGLWGVLLPVFVSLSTKRKHKLLFMAAGLVLLSLSMESWQWYSLFALIPLLFYSGEKGKWNTKYLFYIYYPLHMLVIYGLTLI